MKGQALFIAGLEGADAARFDEFGYGIGRADGIYLMRYRVTEFLDLGSTRQDFLHQLYVPSDGMLACRSGHQFTFVGPRQGYWAARGARHEIWGRGPQTVYRLCLREWPAGASGLPVGPVNLAPDVLEMVQTMATDGLGQDAGLAARRRALAGVSAPESMPAPARAIDGSALEVARRLSRDPADARSLEEWAAELHLSGKTLQRSFQREFGTTFGRWRTQLRLEAARVMLHRESVSAVARYVGFATPSAFIASFVAAYGHTPGALRRQLAEEPRSDSPATVQPSRRDPLIDSPFARRELGATP